MDKSYRTKYSERLSKHRQKFNFKASSEGINTKERDPEPEPSRAKPNPKLSSKYFNAEYAQKKDEEEYDDLKRLLRESHEKSMKYLNSRFDRYVDHYFGLIQLRYKLHQLRMQREQLDFLFDLNSDNEDDSSDESDGDLFDDTLLFGHGFGRKQKEKKPKAKSMFDEEMYKKASTKKGFSLYNKYKDHTTDLELDNGLFSIQVDVGGSKDSEILIDSEENHLTVKSKDSNGHSHTFGIICPKVEDIDLLHIHHPKDGLLVIDGPTKGKSKSEQQCGGKKARTVHM